MSLELDTREIEACVLQALLVLLLAHGFDGLTVVVFKGRQSGAFTAREPGNPVSLAELRELARQAIAADQSDRGELRH